MTTTDTIAYLGEKIADRGISADPVSLDLLAHAARDLGVDDLLVDVMVDDFEPDTARVRAFARVSTKVAFALRDADARDLAPAC